MAIWSSDWPLPPLPSHKTRTKTQLASSIPSPLSLILLPKKQRNLTINSSKSLSSTLVEDSSNDLRIILRPVNSPSQQSSPAATDPEISNRFIHGLCENPQTEALAFEYYQKARDQPNFRPDTTTLKVLIRGLVKSKKWESIAALLEDYEVFNLLPDEPTFVRVIRTCVKARKFKLADRLLGLLETKNGGTAVSCFNSAMQGYNKLHMYSSTIASCDRMRAARLALNSASYRSIMEAYRATGNTDMVLALFVEYKSLHQRPSAVSAEICSILCDSLGRSGRAFEALRYFREMEGEGISPNPSIYASLIRSFAGIREAEIAEDLYDEAREKGLVKDPDIFLKLVMMYVEVGLVEKTIQVVEEMKEIGIRVSDCIFCAVVNGFAKKIGLRASLRAYEHLISLGCEPGQVTYASVINVYCRLGLSKKAEAVFSEMMEKGFDRCVVAYSNIISMYGKTGRVRDAMRLLAMMKEKGCQPNVWVYNSLMDMHGRLMNPRQVEKLWKEMKRRKVVADRISYTSIIGAYSKARKLEDCIKLYQEFTMSGGKTDRALAGTMVGVFSKTSRFNELIELLKDMKSDRTGLDERLYRSALNSLRDAGLQVNAEWLQRSFGSQEDIT
ncbi:uncharacterized protein [Typha angustifolia]|uniref:uncharacterized protein n=1 Tax=Typha angustifolia TaxID=59011 RepID=UPI003C2F1CC1